ncbi:hypothetical protein mRhiFer1_009476 [Rhinolophus ferrumequinum]|uniref:Uncharacterized protein n=1 Tax=Rhinolophus ferrumequinum TaxID=59479 RepID=A0A7J7RET0_RHIFE|nr:hypothetical protein mRhiFer1_009476 [Rhinolophus ferrumequinum]
MERVGKNGESLPPLSQRVPAVPCRGPPVSEGGRLGPAWTTGPSLAFPGCPGRRCFSDLLPCLPGIRVRAVRSGNLIGGAPFGPLLGVSEMVGTWLQCSRTVAGPGTRPFSPPGTSSRCAFLTHLLWGVSCCTRARV